MPSFLRKPEPLGTDKGTTSKLNPVSGDAPFKDEEFSDGITKLVLVKSSEMASMWSGKPPSVEKPVGELSDGQQILCDITAKIIGDKLPDHYRGHERLLDSPSDA